MKTPVNRLLKQAAPTAAPTNETRFRPGASGNPKGRPPGALSHATVLAQALLDGQAQQIVQAAVRQALKGNPAALRLCLDRLIPRAKDRPINLKLPPVRTATDLTSAMGCLIDAVGAGQINPAEATALANVFETHRRSIETAALDRLTALEERQKTENPQ